MTVRDICNKVLDIAKDAREYVAIFADGGWDNRLLKDRYFFVFKDGDGQNPIFDIDYEDYLELKRLDLIGDDTYKGFKARSVFEFNIDSVKNYLNKEDA